MAPRSIGYVDPNAKVSLIWIDLSSREVVKGSQLLPSLNFNLKWTVAEENIAESYRKCVSLEESSPTAAQRLSVGGYWASSFRQLTIDRVMEEKTTAGGWRLPQKWVWWAGLIITLRVKFIQHNATHTHTHTHSSSSLRMLLHQTTWTWWNWLRLLSRIDRVKSVVQLWWYLILVLNCFSTIWSVCYY